MVQTKLTFARRDALAQRDDLIARHLHLVESIARALVLRLPPSIELDDLIGAGNLALIRAAARYAPVEHGGAPFSAYARQVIRGAILDTVRRRNWTAATYEPVEKAPEQIEMPVSEAELDTASQIDRVRRVIRKLPQAERIAVEAYYSDAEPTLETVAQAMAVSTRTVATLHSGAIERVRKALQKAA